MSQIFGKEIGGVTLVSEVFLIFLHEIDQGKEASVSRLMKSEKTNKLALRVEKRSSFKTKEGLKFADTFWRKTIWQQSGQTSAKLVKRLSTCS